MGDLKDPRLMYLKAGMFLVIGVGAAALILMSSPTWQTALLLFLCVWAFCRLYYFAFYVIEKYIDGEYRFAGLWAFVVYVWSRRRGAAPRGER